MIIINKIFIKKYLWICFVNIPILLFVLFIDGGMGTISFANISDFFNELNNPFLLFWFLVFYFGFSYLMTKGIYGKKKNNIWLRSSKMILVVIIICLFIIIIMFPISLLNNEFLKGILLSVLMLSIIITIYLISEKKILIYDDGLVVISNIKKYIILKEEIKNIIVIIESKTKFLKITTDTGEYNISLYMPIKETITLKEKIDKFLLKSFYSKSN